MSQSVHRRLGSRERLVFDASLGELRDGDARYLLIRHDSLMGMFARLPAATRRQALSALGDAVAAAGWHSAQRYRAASSGSSEDLLRTIEATASQLGWGRWTFAPTRAGGLRLDVANSPFAAGAGAFRRKGFTRVSMDEIAAASKVTKRTLYGRAASSG